MLNAAQAKGSILLSPSHLSRHVSPSFNAHLASLSPSSSSSTSSQPKSVYTHQGTNLEIYSTILKGIPLLPLPDRLDRKEAMGIVTLLQGFRGVREVVNDQKFLETYFASDGNPREFVTRGWARNSTDWFFLLREGKKEGRKGRGGGGLFDIVDTIFGEKIT